MDAGRSNAGGNPDYFINYLTNQAFEIVSSEYVDLDLKEVRLLKKSFVEFEKTKGAELHNYLDNCKAREIKLDDLQESLHKDINKFTKKFFKQHKNESFAFGSEDLSIVLHDALCRESILKVAKAKYVMSESFSGSLSPAGTQFLLTYNTLNTQSGYIKTVLKSLDSNKNDVNMQMKNKKLIRSFSINIMIEWNALNAHDKAVLKRSYGITESKVKELSTPLQERYFKPLTNLQEKIESMIAEKENGGVVDNSSIKKKLSDLLLFSKNPLAKTYLKDHQSEIDGLVDRASKLGIVVETRGDSFMI